MESLTKLPLFTVAVSIGAMVLAGCGAETTVTNANVTNTANVNVNTNANIAANSGPAGTAVVEAREPEEYQATVRVNVEAVGEQKIASMPTLTATVARSGDDRRMEFAMPAGGRVVFLDKAGTNYLVLPDRNQYAELNREALGVEVRRMMMPEQIVEQTKGIPGVRLVGEEQYDGRTVLRYEYDSVTDTQTQAGQVATASYLLVDKETGLPLRTETRADSRSGGQVQGYSGLRVITEISDLTLSPEAALFATPTGMERIEAEQVRAQVDIIFRTLGSFIAQVMQQSQPQRAASPAATPGN